MGYPPLDRTPRVVTRSHPTQQFSDGKTMHRAVVVDPPEAKPGIPGYAGNPKLPSSYLDPVAQMARGIR